MNEWILLQPIKIGPLSLRNRIVMPPMCSRLAGSDGSVTQKMIAYYSERARGGVGMIIIEYSYIDEKESRAAVSQLGVQNDHMITGLSELAEAIKAQGAAVVLQICHAGNQTSPAIMGKQPVAPSAIPCKFLGVMPRELTLAEIDEIQDAFAEASRRAKQAGLDGVELHGAHGYLMDQFLSPYTNKRIDKYGGSFENRALFALETLRKVRKKTGTSFAVGYRMTADEYIPGGLTLKETTKFAKMLAKEGIDYLHVTAGIYESLPHFVQPVYLPRAYLVHLAEAIRKEVAVPVITVGSLNVEEGEKALKEEKADLVALGRALIADPEIPKKLAEGRLEDIRPCIRGNEGCISRFFTGQTMRCEVNPATGRENEFRIAPVEPEKRIIVIGGGPAGMEAARVAALRGHKVTLIERSKDLGGHLVEGSRPSFKDDTKRLLIWLTKQVYKVGVEVKLETEATPELIKELKPDVLIIAVGSDPIVSRVPSANSIVIEAADVLLGKREVGDKVVVIGGGLVGCETALYLAEELKKKVAVVEMLYEILTGMEPVSSMALTERLGKAGVKVHTGWHLEEITPDKVVCTDKMWKRHEIDSDTVVLAMGLKAKNEATKEFIGIAPEVHVIGDCVEARKIYNAFEDSWRAVLAT